MKNKESKKNIGENVLPVIVHERMGTVFEISGKIGHSGTILYRVPNVWEWPQREIMQTQDCIDNLTDKVGNLKVLIDDLEDKQRVLDA